MHPPEKIQQFFELRSRGNCLGYISTAINVPTSTLGDWNRRYAVDIEACRACKWEAAEQAVKFNSEADLVRVIQRLNAFERELDRRPLGSMSVGELVRVISLWRREYFRRRNALLRPIEQTALIPKSDPEISGNLPDLPPWNSRGPRPSPAPATPASPAASAVPRAPTANAQSEPKPEKTGIPESHFPTFSPAPPHAPPLFSIDDHIPAVGNEWLPDNDNELIVYAARPG